MLCRPRLMFALIVSAAAVLSPLCLRAKECPGGERPLTALEKKFFDRLTDVQSFLPGPPDGWRVIDMQVDGPSAICKDEDEAYLSGRMLLRGIVSETFESQRSSGDRAPGDSSAADTTKDFRALVRITVNSLGERFPCGAAVPLEVKGAVAAFRLTGRSELIAGQPEVMVDGVTVLLLGPWKAVPTKGELRATAEGKAGTPHTTMQTMLIEIRADKARAAQILGEINIDALAKGLGS